MSELCQAVGIRASHKTSGLMKVLCDVHIARKVARFFEGEGIEAIHVNDILDSITPAPAAFSPGYSGP